MTDDRAFPLTVTHSIVDDGIPARTAKDSPNDCTTMSGTLDRVMSATWASSFGWVLSIVTTGSFWISWCSAASSKITGSTSVRRTSKATTRTRADARNGIRHPQPSRSASLMAATGRKARADRMRPPAIPDIVNDG